MPRHATRRTRIRRRHLESATRPQRAPPHLHDSILPFARSFTCPTHGHRTAINRACHLLRGPRAHRRHTCPATDVDRCYQRLTPDDTVADPWPPFAHHMTRARLRAQAACCRTMVNLCLPAARVNKQTTIALGRRLHTGGWGSAVARSCEQSSPLLCRVPRSIGVARKCASTVCGDRQRRRHVTCASCTSVCYTPPVHPMHYACSCTAPTQEQAHLASCCFPQLFSLLCSLHCVPPPRFC